MVWIIVLLGLIQGLTEFLPISSSGHLVLLYDIFGIENNQIFLSIILHLATLLAVIIYYRKDIIKLIKNPFCKTNKKLFLTTVTTCVIVLFLKPVVEKTFDGKYLFVFFLLTAVILFISDYMSDKNTKLSYNDNKLSKTRLTDDYYNICDLDISYKQAFIIGVTQAVACIPGISRSGSTIAIAKICGVKKDCAKYSFLISIPIIIASLIMELISGVTFDSFNIGLIISLIVCFIVGLLSIKIMTSFVDKNKLFIFGYYLIILSAFLILNDMVLHLF